MSSNMNVGGGMGSNTGMVGGANDVGSVSLYTSANSLAGILSQSSIEAAEGYADANNATPPNNPTLPNPSNPPSGQQQLPQNVDGSTPDTVFSTYANTELKALLAQNNITVTSEQFSNLLFAYYENIPLKNYTDLPPNIPSDLFTQLDSKITADEYNKFTSLDTWTVNEGKQTQMQEFASAYNNAFENLIAQKFPGDNQLQAQLRVAFYLQGNDPTGQLQDIEKEALASLQSEYSNPVGWVPKPDSTQFQAKTIVSFDDQFETLLKKQPNLSDTQQQALLSMHYYYAQYLSEYATQNNTTPDQVLSDPNATQGFWNFLNTKIPGASDLQGVFTQITSSAQSTISAQYVLPSNYVVPAGTGSYEAQANGAWRMDFDDILSTYTPAQQAAVNAAIADSTKMTPDTQALINEISQKAQQDIIAKYQMPVDWQPSLTLAPLNPGVQVIKNGIANLQQIYDSLLAQVNTMPDSPMKQQILNILKVINDAISYLEQEIYYIEGMAAQKAKALGQAQQQATLDKIAQQLKALHDMWEQQAEAERQHDKAAKWGLLAKIFTPILVIAAVVMTVCTGGTFGPVAITLIVICATAMCADSIYNSVTGHSFVQQFFSKITDLAREAGLGGAIMAYIFEYALIIAVTVLTANPMLGAMLFAQSGLMASTLEACGTSDDKAEFVSMIVNIVVMIVAMGGVAAMGRMAAKATAQATKVAVAADEGAEGASVGGQAAEGAAQSAAKSAAKAAEEAASKPSWYATNVWKAASSPVKASKLMSFFTEDFVPTTTRLLGAGTGAANATASIYTAKELLIRAKVAEEQGDLDDFLANAEALIKILEASKNQLLQSLSGLADWGAQSQQQITSMYNQLTQVSNNIAGASHG